MLKKLMLVYGIIFTLVVGIYVGEILFGTVSVATGSLNLLNSGMATSSSDFASSFISYNILGFITVIVCAIALEKKQENYLLRIAPCIAFANLLIFAVSYTGTIEISGFSLSGTVVMDVAKWILERMVILYVPVLPLCFLFSINPNNALTGVIKKITLFIIGGNAISGIWFLIAGAVLSNNPSIYSNSYELAKSTMESYLWAFIFFIVTLIIEVVLMGLAFITNYALNSEDMEADEIDYEELMRRADYIAQTKQNALVGNAPKDIASIDRSVSNTTGAMNVNNQLGVESNVGKVSDANRANLRTDYIDKGLIAVGPVANQAVASQVQDQQPMQPTIQAQPQVMQQQVQPVQQPIQPQQTQPQVVQQPAPLVQVQQPTGQINQQ